MSGDTWRTEAACRGRIDEMEVTVTVGKAARARQAERGKAVCAGCPVVSHCSAWLSSHVEEPCGWHVVAGSAPSERRHLWAIQPARGAGSDGGRPRGELVCGTEAGWYRHRRWDGKTVTCEACIEARREAEKLRKRVRFTQQRQHGTEAMYVWHVRIGQVPCDECKRAHADRESVRRGGAVWTLGRPVADRQHGTYTGYTQHTRRGEVACDDCREARNEYVRLRRSRGAA